MKLANDENIKQIAKELKFPIDTIKLFIDEGQERISEYQINESIRVRERIIQKTLFDYRPNIPTFSIGDVEDELEKNLYFITLQFDPATHYLKFGKNQQIAQEKAIASLYTDLSNQFIDHAFARNSRLLPFVQLYLDAEGTRYTRFIDEIRIPHYHGFMLLNPKTVARFEHWLFENGRKTTIKGNPAIELAARHHRPIETITFEKFDPTVRPLRNLITYTTKFARNETFWNSCGDELEFSIFHPQMPERSYAFYKEITYPIFTQDELISFENNN